VLVTFCVPIFVCSQCLRRKPCYLPGSGHCLTCGSTKYFTRSQHPASGRELHTAADLTQQRIDNGSSLSAVQNSPPPHSRQLRLCSRLRPLCASVTLSGAQLPRPCAHTTCPPQQCLWGPWSPGRHQSSAARRAQTGVLSRGVLGLGLVSNHPGVRVQP
jgi:hypothetical protein